MVENFKALQNIKSLILNENVEKLGGYIINFVAINMKYFISICHIYFRFGHVKKDYVVL